MQRRKLQVVFDCQDPEKLAKFYAEALGYKMQDPPSGFQSWEEALTAWNVPKEEWNSASAIVDPEGFGPRIYFQRMDTPKPQKNRLHIDINASGGPNIPLDQRKKEVKLASQRIASLGANEQQEHEEMGEYWIVMLDPEANEFCVQ